MFILGKEWKINNPISSHHTSFFLSLVHSQICSDKNQTGFTSLGSFILSLFLGFETCFVCLCTPLFFHLWSCSIL